MQRPKHSQMFIGDYKCLFVHNVCLKYGVDHCFLAHKGHYIALSVVQSCKTLAHKDLGHSLPNMNCERGEMNRCGRVDPNRG